MDFLTQRLIAIGIKFLAELRLLRNGIQQLIRAVHNAEEAHNQQRQQPPPVMRAELQIPEAIERDRARRDDRSYRTQKWLAVVTTLAFIAAAVYAAIAALQWTEMRKAQRPRVGVVFGSVSLKKPPPNTTAEYNNLAFTVKLRNYGLSPALWVDEEFKPMWDRMDIKKQQDQTCEHATRRESGRWGKLKGFGQTIFPIPKSP